MKIVRWLLSHIILILLIVVVIYGYMFWGRLTDADTPGGKAVAYLSDKFAPVEEFVNATKAKQAKLSDKQSIEGNAQEDDKQNEDDKLNIVTDMDATSEDVASEPVANNIESSMLDRRSEVSVNNTQFINDDTSSSASAVDKKKDIKDNFVTPDVEAKLNGVASVTAPVDANNSLPKTNVQSEVSINDERFSMNDTNASAGAGAGAVAGAVAVERSKNAFVSPDVEAQLKSVDNDGAIVDTSNVQPLTDQPSDVSVNDAPSTIGDAVASASASAVGIVKDFFVSPKVDDELNNADDTAEVVAATSQQGANEKSIDVKASWITARKSYFQRNYELSEKSYQQVIDNTEDNYDAYGELGNVYFNQGKNIQAASAYYEAAAIFVRTGHLPRAKSLIGLLRRLDKSKADELQQLIDTTPS